MTTTQWTWFVASATALLILAAAGWRWRARRRRRAAHARAPAGFGAALAHALDGQLDEADSRLLAMLRGGEIDRADGTLGLVAVRRARGDLSGAAELLTALARSGTVAPWLVALRVRIALDRGRVDEACALIGPAERLPLDLCLAAYCRAGRWEEALRLFRARTTRKNRSNATYASLVAGQALADAAGGDERNARRGYKRAAALDSGALLVTLAGVWLHPRAQARQGIAAQLTERVADVAATLGPAGGIQDAGSPAVARARADLADEIPVEVVLGTLRDAIDEKPEAWDVRRMYVELLLEHGTPDDWRRELADVLAISRESTTGAQWFRCSRCDFRAATAFFVCPRCDALGSIEVAATVGHSSGRTGPSVEGARLADLTSKLGAVTPLDRS